MGSLLTLVIFFGIMFISHYLLEIVKVLKDIKDKL
jgi:hypothetical protein